MNHCKHPLLAHNSALILKMPHSRLPSMASLSVARVSTKTLPTNKIHQLVSAKSVLCIVLFALFLHDSPFIAPSTTMAASIASSGKGLLKLCPPGGESFANAWQITCGMRRRRKRDAMPTDSEDGNIGSLNGTAAERNASKPMLEEHIVAREAAEAVAGAAVADPEPLITSGGGRAEPALHRRAKRGLFSFSSSSAGHHDLDLDYESMPSSMGSTNGMADATTGGSAVYRAPSLSEIMMLCCRYGCSLRDLLPYCDPFGEWES